MNNYLPNADNRQPIYNLYDLIVHDLGFSFFSTVDKAKIKLSDTDSVLFDFPLPRDHIKETITRPDFDKLITYLVQESAACIDETLTSAGLRSADITSVILTGGSSQIPLFHSMIAAKFGSDKIIVSDPFTSVALGLALKADQLFAVSSSQKVLIC